MKEYRKIVSHNLSLEDCIFDKERIQDFVIRHYLLLEVYIFGKTKIQDSDYGSFGNVTVVFWYLERVNFR